MTDLKGKVIEALNEEHALKIIEFFKSNGYSTEKFYGKNTKENGSAYRFYGVNLHGQFGCWLMPSDGMELIALPLENEPQGIGTKPKEEKEEDETFVWGEEVEVTDDEGEDATWNREFLVGQNPKSDIYKYISVDESGDPTTWKHCRKIVEPKITYEELQEFIAKARKSGYNITIS